MAITVETFIDLITIDPSTAFITWRQVTLVKDNGAEIARSYHRVAIEALVTDPVFPTEITDRINVSAIRTPELMAAAIARRDAIMGVIPPPP